MYQGEQMAKISKDLGAGLKAELLKAHLSDDQLMKLLKEWASRRHELH